MRVDIRLGLRAVLAMRSCRERFAWVRKESGIGIRVLVLHDQTLSSLFTANTTLRDAKVVALILTVRLEARRCSEA